MISSFFLDAKYGESGLIRFLKLMLVLISVASFVVASFMLDGMIECLMSTYYLGAAVGCWALLIFGSNSRFVQNLYYVHDALLGLLASAIILLLAGLYVPGKIQTWLLYNNALSRGVVIEDILRASSQNEDRDDELSLQQMRSIIMEQQRVISALAGSGSDSDDRLRAQVKEELVHTMSDNALSALRNVSESDLAAIHDASRRLQAIVQRDPTPPNNYQSAPSPSIRRSYSTSDEEMRAMMHNTADSAAE